MSILVGCELALRQRPKQCYVLATECYQSLRDLLDQNQTGWVEMDHAHEGGKLFFRLEDVADLFLVTPEYCANKESWDAVNKED